MLELKTSKFKKGSQNHGSFHFAQRIYHQKFKIAGKSRFHSAKFQISAYPRNQPINSACLDCYNVHIDIRQKLSTELVFSLKTKLKHEHGLKQTAETV